MKKFLFCTLLFIPLCISAQSNQSDTLKLKANLSLTGFFQGGNVQTLIFRAKSDVTYKPWKKWVFNTKNSYVYQEFGQEKADEDVLSLNFLYFNPERKVYPLVLAFVSTNFRREIDWRSLFGAGVTYKILNKKGKSLKVSVTSEYEQTEFNEDQFNRSEFNGNKSINTFRGTVWINGKYQLLEKKLVVTHESYFQPSLEQSGNYRWQADVGVELPISKKVNFKVNYLHTFESIVVVEQDEEDRFLTFGFTIKNY